MASRRGVPRAALSCAGGAGEASPAPPAPSKALDELPGPVIQNIFAHLEQEDLVNCSSTSRTMRNEARHPVLWRRASIRFPGVAALRFLEDATHCSEIEIFGGDPLVVEFLLAALSSRNEHRHIQSNLKVLMMFVDVSADMFQVVPVSIIMRLNRFSRLSVLEMHVAGVFGPQDVLFPSNMTSLSELYFYDTSELVEKSIYLHFGRDAKRSLTNLRIAHIECAGSDIVENDADGVVVLDQLHSLEYRSVFDTYGDVRLPAQLRSAELFVHDDSNFDRIGTQIAALERLITLKLTFTAVGGDFDIHFGSSAQHLELIMSPVAELYVNFHILRDSWPNLESIVVRRDTRPDRQHLENGQMLHFYNVPSYAAWHHHMYDVRRIRFELGHCGLVINTRQQGVEQLP